MVRKYFSRVAFILSLPVVGSAPLYGQATFSVASSTVDAADVGVTEPAGLITLTVISGTTVEAPLSIRFSAPITNNSMSEVQVYGTGGLLSIPLHPTLDAANNAVLINVPAGGGPGNEIRIIGVRVAIPGLEDDRVTATVTSLTAGGNAISIGQNLVIVIDRFLPPFSVQLSTFLPLQVQNGVPSAPGAFFLIKEGFASAFSDAIGLYGQTVPIRFRVHPFPSIPEGVKLTFVPEAHSTETLAVLRTASGTAETVPRVDGSTDVEYVFDSDPVYSSRTVESFRVDVTVEVDPDAASGPVTFQATLEPIGVAHPNAQFPSTAIPRYLELTLPDETDLLTGTVELTFPFRAKSDAIYTGIAITNPLNYRVKASLTAYDANGLIISGPGVNNPVSLILPRLGQYAKLATQIFGLGFNASTMGSIRLVGNTSVLAGFYLEGKDNGSGLDGVTADIDPLYRFVWPAVFHQGPDPFTMLEFFNPGEDLARVSLEIFDSSGHSVASATQSVLPGGTVLRDIRDIFTGLNLSSFDQGYMKGRSDVPVVARETFGNGLDFNVLAAQTAVQRARFEIAHFASGGGYQTELNLINLDSTIPASVTLTAMDANGIPYSAPGNPAQVTIPPTGQVVRSVADLFPGLPSGLQTGYFRVDVEPVDVGYFTSVPPLAGYVRFSAADGYGSSALAIDIPGVSDFVYSHVAQGLGYYNGIAMVNTNDTAVLVTLEVYEPSGERVGIFSTYLQPGQKLSKLLYELVPASLGQVGGYVRITSPLPITSFSLFGTDDGLSLSAVPPQNVSN